MVVVLHCECAKYQIQMYTLRIINFMLSADFTTINKTPC